MSELKPPTPAQIRAAREAAGLTQTQAATLVHVALRTWQHWEEPRGGDGAREIPLGLWELFLIKTKGRARTVEQTLERMRQAITRRR